MLNINKEKLVNNALGCFIYKLKCPLNFLSRKFDVLTLML